MKKVLFVMLVAVFAFALPVCAQDQGGFGLRVDYFSPSEDDIDDGYGAGVTYLIPLQNDFNLEIALDYIMAEDESGYVDVSVIPVTFTARYQFTASDVIYPYVGAGIGYYYATMEGDWEYEWCDDNGCYHEEWEVDESESDFGFHAVVGMDYKTDSGAFTTEVKWSQCEIGDWDDSDVGGLTFSAGYRFAF